MRQVLSTLPSRHHDCLEFLIFHLSRVTEHKAKNLMDAKNLSVCFAPTIMRTRDINDEMTEYQNKNLAVQCMIEYNREIFLAGGEGQSGISRTSG